MSFLTEILDAAAKDELLEVPPSKYWAKNWKAYGAPLDVVTKKLPSFVVTHETAQKILAITGALSPEEMLRVVNNVRLPFPEFWVEFNVNEQGAKNTAFETWGIHLLPVPGGEVFCRTWIKISRKDRLHVIVGCVPSAFVFSEALLPKVENAFAFFDGLDKSDAGRFAFNTKLLTIPQAELDELNFPEEDWSPKTELEKGSIRGLSYIAMGTRTLQMELFVFMWLLGARIIKPYDTLHEISKRKTKTRGTVRDKIESSLVEIDLLRVKEINRPQSQSTGRHVAEHAVMGHWCVRKKSGIKYWRTAHSRGSEPSKNREGYKL